MSAINGVKSMPVRTRYERERVAGQSYHRVTILSRDVIMPAAFMAVLTEALQDENFAFGAVKGRLTFLFRTKHDAEHFQACLREVNTAAGER